MSEPGESREKNVIRNACIKSGYDLRVLFIQKFPAKNVLSTHSPESVC